MRLSVPVGNSGVRVQTGCLTTPMVLLVYAVFGGVVLSFYAVAAMLALVVLVLAWSAYGALWLFWTCRLTLARRKVRKRSPAVPPKSQPPESPARYSNRR